MASRRCLRPALAGLLGLLAGLLGLLAGLAMSGCGGGTSTTGGGIAAGSLGAEAERGQRIALESGCAACHGPSWRGGVGPTWVGLAGSTITLDDGTTRVADHDYLVRAIVDPPAERAGTFSMKMPPNLLTDDQVSDVVAFIEAIGGAPD